MKKLIIGFLILCPSFISAQNVWHDGGNISNKEKPTVGTKNDKSIDIITNDTARVSVASTGEVDVKGDMRVRGVLSIGDSTVTLSENDPVQGGLFTTEIVSSDRRMALGSNVGLQSFMINPSQASNFSLGIGGSHHSYKLQLEDQSGLAV